MNMKETYGAGRAGFVIKDLDGRWYAFDAMGKFLGETIDVSYYTLEERNIISVVSSNGVVEIFVEGKKYIANKSFLEVKKALLKLDTGDSTLYRIGTVGEDRFTQMIYPVKKDKDYKRIIEVITA